MDDGKQPVTRSRYAQTCMPHNGSASNYIRQRTDDAQSGSTLTTRYSQIIIREPSTAEPKRAKRKRITAEQLRDLTAVFDTTDTPTHDIREVLSKKLGMTNREVQVWFQNRRAKYNRQRMEQQRQMRTNAAIIYVNGMAATRMPLQAPPPPPPPPPPMPYTHLQPQPSYPPDSLTRPLTAAIGTVGSQTGDGYPRKWPAPAPAAEPYVQFAYHSGPIQTHATNHTVGGSRHGQVDDLPIDATRAAIAGNALLQLSETRTASAFARPQLGDAHRPVGLPHMQTPALTSASMTAYCAYSESPSASPHRPNVHGPSPQISSDASFSQCQRQRQLLPHALGRAMPPARRNTVSSYQTTGRSPQVYPLPLPVTAPGMESMAARNRYRPEMPASYYGRQCRHSANRSPSPSHGHYRHFGADIPSAHVLSATNANALASQPDGFGCGVKLPSIQAILASVDHNSSRANEKACHPSPLQVMPRSRAYTSPPLTTAEQGVHESGMQLPQPSTLASSLQPWTMAGVSENQCTNYTPSAINYRNESPADEAKLAIDMLATAAVSVSSARSSCSLPHLTPLSEFSVRAASQQQSSPANTPSLQPQEAQAADSKSKSSRSWRPW
ncbi:hypothetical protein GGI21_001044 [Coemansia aciculifera]|nr:hypothetical protein GGI21_001044 [Coemansia aciculifera]